MRLGFRAAQDELFRVTELIEAQRDLLTGALEVHLSTVSNRLNEVMRRLAAVVDDLPADHVPVGLLRPELRLHGAPRRRRARRSCSARCCSSLVAVGVVAFLHLRRWI